MGGTAWHPTEGPLGRLADEWAEGIKIAELVVAIEGLPELIDRNIRLAWMSGAAAGFQAATEIAGGPAWILLTDQNRPEGDVLLGWAGVPGRVVTGFWDSDRYAKTPRPYWNSEMTKSMGIVWSRRNPPTHYRPIGLGPPEVFG